MTRGRSISLKSRQILKGVIYVNTDNKSLTVARYKRTSKGYTKLKLSSNRKLYIIIKKK